MEGAQVLTPEMDVYAFGICCWEILNMGAVPWPLTEDSTVRHLVLSAHHLLHYSAFSRAVMLIILLPGHFTRQKHEARASAFQSPR